jgi:hypothetical protein
VRPSLRRVGRLLLPDWLAVTLGRTVVSWRRLDHAERAHELCHVRQWEAVGRWLYPLSYAQASLRAWRQGGHWYRDNPYEVEARAAAQAAATQAAADPTVADQTAAPAPTASQAAGPRPRHASSPQSSGSPQDVN